MNVKSKLAWNKILIISTIAFFFGGLIYWASSLDDYGFWGSTLLRLLSLSIFGFTIYHFYSIPIIKIKNARLSVIKRGNSIHNITLDQIRNVSYFVRSKHYTYANVAHRIQTTDETIEIPIGYYSNYTAMLRAIDSESREHQLTTIPSFFSLRSLLVLRFVLRSFTSTLYLVLFMTFITAFSSSINWQDIYVNHPVILFSILLFASALFFTLIKLNTKIDCTNGHLVQYQPFLLIKRKIEIRSIKKAKLIESYRGQGITIRTLYLITKANQHIEWNAQLNSKKEVKKIYAAISHVKRSNP